MERIGPWSIDYYHNLNTRTQGLEPPEYFLRYAHDERVIKQCFDVGGEIDHYGFYTQAAINETFRLLDGLKRSYNTWQKASNEYHELINHPLVTKEMAFPYLKASQKEYRTFTMLAKHSKRNLAKCLDAWHEDGRLLEYEDYEDAIFDYCASDELYRACKREILVAQVGKGYPDTVYQFGKMTKDLREPGDDIMCAQWLADTVDDIAQNFWAKMYADGHGDSVAYDASRMMERAAVYCGEIGFCPQGCLDHMQKVCEAAMAGQFDVPRYDAYADVSQKLTPTIEEMAAEHGYFFEPTGEAVARRRTDIMMGKIADELSVSSTFFTKAELSDMGLG